MATSFRSRRITIAAGVLSVALVAPSVVPVDGSFAVFAAAQTVASGASDFVTRYDAENFWGKQTAAVEGLALKPGDTIEPTGLNTAFRWGVTADSNGTIQVTRPRDGLTFDRAKNAGQADIGVRVTPRNGSPYNTTLRITVTDVDPGPTPEEKAHRAKFTQRYQTENFWGVDEAKVEGLQLEAGDQIAPRDAATIFRWGVRANDDGTVTVTRPESTTAYRAGNRDINVRVTPVNGAAYDAVLQLNVIDTEPPLTDEEQATRAQFDQRYDTANFWNEQTVEVPELKLQPGDQIAPRDAETIFRWGVSADADGNVTVTRPESPVAYRAGNRDINVRVAPADGRPFDAVLKLNVIDQREAKDWEKQLDTRYPLDFEKSTSAKPVTEITLPDGVSVSKAGIIAPSGWSVATDGNTVRVSPPSTFKEGDFDLPIKVNDGTDQFDAVLKIAATNPQQTPAETAGTAAGIIGGLLGPILGGLIPGIGGGGGEGGTGGGGGRLVDIKIGADNNVIITGNANPNVEIKDNASNNGNPSVVITDNVNPRDNLSNNGSNNSAVVTGNANPVITGNANPVVDIKDNGSNNGSNNSAVVTGNANPVVTGNANPVITGNANPTVVITGNANPVITGNANDNGSNNSAVVTGNANPVVTGNANPVITGNANDNGSNNSAVVTGNANPVVTGNANPVITGNANPVITGNANPVITGNANPVITGNANPVITGNANPTVVITGNANPNVEIKDNANPEVDGIPLGSSGGGSSKRGGEGGEGGEGAGNGGSSSGGSSNSGSSIGADVEATGGLSDPRCVAGLVGLGVPLLLAIPVSLAQGLNIPGLDQLSAQAMGALNDAARNFGIEPAQATAIAGGLIGATLAVLAALAITTCIPQVRNVGITVGGPKTSTVVAQPEEPQPAN